MIGTHERTFSWWMWKCKSLIASPVSITIMQNYFVLEQYGQKTIMQSHWKTVIRFSFMEDLHHFSVKFHFNFLCSRSPWCSLKRTKVCSKLGSCIPCLSRTTTLWIGPWFQVKTIGIRVQLPVSVASNPSSSRARALEWWTRRLMMQTLMCTGIENTACFTIY